MQFQISQVSLAQALKIVAPLAVKQGNNFTVLSHVLFRTEGSALLCVEATNLEVSLQIKVPAEIKAPGAVTLPAKKLNDYLSALPADTIEARLNQKTSTLHLKCANFDAHLKGADESEFPTIAFAAEHARSQEIVIDPEVLRTGIRMTRFSIAPPTEERTILTGLEFAVQSDVKQASFAAADGFRAARMEMGLTEVAGGAASIVLPRIGLQIIEQLTGDTEDPVHIWLRTDQTGATFLFPNATLHTHTVEGKFPDVQSIVPAAPPSFTFAVSRDELLKAVRASDVFARDDSRRIHLSVEAEAKNAANPVVRVRSESETGNNVVCLDAAGVNGKPHPIVLNAHFLEEMLGAERTPVVEFSDTGVLTPVLFRGKGNLHFTHVVMPMHFDE